MKGKKIASAVCALISLTACTVGVLTLGTACDSLKGEQGLQGEQGIQGEKGEDGVGIVDIEKISSDGLVDTYKISFTDGGSTTFSVTNGEQGVQGLQGVQGEAGKNGATWTYGNGAPTSSSTAGDLYLDSATTDVYVYANNAWSKICSLKGEQGDDAAHANEKHTVTFAPDGGTLPEGTGSSVAVAYGDLLDLPIPTRENYTFEGWYTGVTVNDGKFTSVTPVTKTLTLIARWKANVSYRLTYETNGGNAIAATTHYFDEALTELPEPVKYDCSFVGWYQDEELSTPVGYPLTLTQNETIYAKWKTAYYYVNFHANCDTAIESVNAPAGTSFTAFSAPENDTFEFAGWYLDSGFTKAVEYPFELHSNVDLFAKWKDVYYTFSFVSNGGSQVAAQSYRAGVGIDSLPTPTRKDYRFDGWFEDFDLTVPVAFPYAITQTKTLYAKWTWVDPYADYVKIYDTVQFQQIDNLNGKYVLMNDLDFENETIGRIGSSSAPFTGTFDGNGYTISNAVFSASGTHLGLFAINNGTITNVKLENVSSSVSYSSKTYSSLLTAENNGTITKVSVSGTLTIYTDSNSTMKSYVGLIAATNNGQINNCAVSGKINLSRHYSYNNVYIGTVSSSNNGKIFNCYSSASISSTDGKSSNLHLGGIVSNNAGELTSCVFVGSICNAEELGAIVCTSETGATSEKCYEYSNATGGTAITISNLNSSDFYTSTLGWSTEIWDLSALDFQNGLFAKLK